MPRPPRARRATPLGRIGLASALVVAAVLALAAPADAQQGVGFKLPGSRGLRAGSQLQPGLYVGTDFAWYGTGSAYDRDGHRLSTDFDLDVYADILGAVAVFPVDVIRATWGVTIAVPIARLTVEGRTDRSPIDQFGLADVYVQPVHLGWRLPHVDLLLGYGFYAPTGLFDPSGNSVSAGQWSHELVFGGTAYLDRERRYHLSVVAGAEFYQKKLGIDLHRGDNIQLQGGIGAQVLRILDVGVAGFANWQVTDDSGATLPPPLFGARSVSYALGPEVSVQIPPIRAALALRYEAELAVRASTRGHVALVALTFKPF